MSLLGALLRPVLARQHNEHALLRMLSFTQTDVISVKFLYGDSHGHGLSVFHDRSFSTKFSTPHGNHGIHGPLEYAHLLLPGAPQQRKRRPYMQPAFGSQLINMRHAATDAVVSAASNPAVSNLLVWNPGASVLAGVILGMAVLAKLYATGKILGVAGTIRGLFQGDLSAWRLSFLGGLMSGALLLTLAMDNPWDCMPESFTVTRAAMSGLCVGLGVSLGNGCMSGHAIAGTGRLSTRSAAFTAAFLLAGFAVATVFCPAQALAVPNIEPEDQAFSLAHMVDFACVAGLALAALGAVSALERSGRVSSGQLVLASDYLVGLLYALGMGMAGMTHPSKVSAALSYFFDGWDPSVFISLLTASLLVAAGFQAMSRLKLPARPLLADKFLLPTSTEVDPRLVAGGIFFGVGWGLSGYDPASALMNVLNPSVQTYTFLAAMMVVMMGEGLWYRVAAARLRHSGTRLPVSHTERVRQESGKSDA